LTRRQSHLVRVARRGGVDASALAVGTGARLSVARGRRPDDKEEVRTAPP